MIKKRKQLVVTVEYSDGTPAKSLEPRDPEDIQNLLKDLVLNMSVSSKFIGIYITRADSLKFLPQRELKDEN